MVAARMVTPRIPEDEQMAAELTAYLESFGPDLWQ